MDSPARPAVFFRSASDEPQPSERVAVPTASLQDQRAAAHARIAELEAALEREGEGVAKEVDETSEVGASMQVDSEAASEAGEEDADDVVDENAEAKRDWGDGVYRCTNCFYEVAFGTCDGCGLEFERDEGMKFADNELAAANPDNEVSTADEVGDDYPVESGDPHAELRALGYSNAMISRYQLMFERGEKFIVAVADDDLWDTFAPLGWEEVKVGGRAPLSVQEVPDADAEEQDVWPEMEDVPVEAQDATARRAHWKIHLPADILIALSAHDPDGRDFMHNHVDDLFQSVDDVCTIGSATSPSAARKVSLDVVTLEDGQNGWITRSVDTVGKSGTCEESLEGTVVFVSLEEHNAGVRQPVYWPVEQRWVVSDEVDKPTRDEEERSGED
ncbi:hypothetical protein JCM10450v2_001039 [Rhodotorula kratochvilovae]